MDTPKPDPVKEVSAGGFVMSSKNSNEVAVIGKLNRGGRLEWCVPKGHPEVEESIEEAAIREVFEETGLKAEILDYLGEVKYDFSMSRKHISKTVHIFLMKQVGGVLSLEFDPHHEATEVTWVKVEELISKLTHPNEKRIAKVLVKKLEDQS
jgi:8-oxo-dGTP pyrophosphatase MutT (NUDIX family)